ncbi:PREDICTED: cytochrome c1-2, heme protein, mitochondrial-like isoform X1 [Polistes canadensis]|uniref:cytochrome c1-2, heme protein, mitochondrial-like isoform X1 n=1 Tax=Polistes canadensis TaxID=91411 RepID=UPI000718BB41|nr:PREDICTED: cytochrome c1-2, heme protein, mitochondrial-like isoform X1 [Polistes canadensis]
MFRISMGVLAGAATTCGSVLYFLDRSVKADITQAMPPSYPWKFDGIFTSLDHAAVRRGWQVYKTICGTCHSLEYVRFMDLVNVSHTRDEVAAIAADYEIVDGPDEEGNYYKRPGKLSDRIPPPFPNEEAAKFANNGSYPPDLTYIVLARKNGRNYIFSLLTGFMDPPAGLTISDTQQFNPYFPGSAIAMTQLLQDGVIDYDDGTPSTKAQMSKDVVEFLSWTCSQEHDTRKLMTIKAIGISIILMISVLHMKKSIWTNVINQRIFNISRDKCE